MTLQIENPIKHGADQIRSITQRLVTRDLAGNFPRNYEYPHGDYNLIFELMRQYSNRAGFTTSADMIVLTPTAEILSGRASRYIADWYNYWEISRSNLNPTPDINIVRFGEKLIKSLFSHLTAETRDQEDPTKIEQVVKILAKKKQTLRKVSIISRQSLVEMGESPQDRSIRVADQLDDSDIDKLSKAFKLFQSREDLVKEAQELGGNMRVKPLEEWFAKQVTSLTEQDIFPENHKINGKRWLLPQYSNNYTRLRSNHNPWVQTDRGSLYWYWAVSEDGQTVECQENWLDSELRKPQSCPEHFLSQSSQIMDFLIRRTVLNYFPKLKYPKPVELSKI